MTSTNTNRKYFYTKPLEYISKHRHCVSAFLVASSSFFHSSIIPYILMSGNDHRVVQRIGSHEDALFSSNFLSNNTSNDQDQLLRESHLHGTIISPFSLHFLQSGFSYQMSTNSESPGDETEDEEMLGFSSTLWKNLAFVTNKEQMDLQDREAEGSNNNRNEQKIPQHDAIFFEDAESRLLELFTQSNTFQFTSSICVYSLSANEVKDLIFKSLFHQNQPQQQQPLSISSKTLQAFTYGGTNVGIVLKALLENCLVLEYLNLSYSSGWSHFFTDYVIRINKNSEESNTINNSKNSKVEILVVGAHKSLKVLKMDKTLPTIEPHQEQPLLNFLNIFSKTLECLVFRGIKGRFPITIADAFPTSLTSLSLNEILGIDDIEVAQKLVDKICRQPQQCPELQHIKFKNGFNQFQVDPEIVMDEKHPDFDLIKFTQYKEKCAARVDLMRPIGEMFAKLLRTLDLEACWSLNDDVLITAFTPELFQHLTHLNLARCQGLTGKGLKKAFANSFIRLQYLNLSDCAQVDDDATWFLEPLPSISTSSSSSTSPQRQHHHHQLLIQSFEYLNLCGTQCGEKTIQRLSPFVNLRFLALENFANGGCGLHFQENITDESLRKLKNLTKIETLHLRGWAGAGFTDEGLREWLLNCTRLQSLTLSDCEGITKKTLETLALRKRKFGVEEDLQDLDLRFCDNIDDVTAVRVLTGLRYLKCSIFDLKLSTAAETAKVIKELKCLRSHMFRKDFEKELQKYM